MTRFQTARSALLGATALLSFGVAATPSRAQSPDARLGDIQAQIRALNAELTRVKRDMAAKDAAVRAAQQDAAHARETAEKTEATVANLPLPSGFKPGDGRASQLSLAIGAGPANPQIPSPKTDWTSVNVNGVSASQQNAGVAGPLGTFHIGGLTIQLGGFVALEGLFRTRNESTSIGSNYGAIPLAQSAQYHENEFRVTSQQSRFSLLVNGNINDHEKLESYAELDLLGAAPTANTNESNSYTPRLRQAYVSYDNDASDWHALAGQSWSLATLFRQGVTPHQENVPYTIDAQYVPGFTWARQPQIRVAKGFDGGKLFLAASVESPQTVFAVGPNGTGNAGTVNFNNPGIPQLDPNANYSADIAPDVIVKAAADPGYGHYELYGLGRVMRDRVSFVGTGHNNTRFGGGVGAGPILPLIGNQLTFQASGLAGYGIGRYGSGQLADATISSNGNPAPLPGFQALVGLTGHPTPDYDLYSYVGTEQTYKSAFNLAGKPFGYGNPLYSNAGCDIELSTATCTGETSGLVQGTLGAWWRFFQGPFGTVQSGVQYSYTRRAIFKGTVAPTNRSGNSGTDDNIIMFSLRFLPFQ